MRKEGYKSTYLSHSMAMSAKYQSHSVHLSCHLSCEVYATSSSDQEVWDFGVVASCLLSFTSLHWMMDGEGLGGVASY